MFLKHKYALTLSFWILPYIEVSKLAGMQTPLCASKFDIKDIFKEQEWSNSGNFQKKQLTANLQSQTGFHTL